MRTPWWASKIDDWIYIYYCNTFNWSLTKLDGKYNNTTTNCIIIMDEVLSAMTLIAVDGDDETCLNRIQYTLSDFPFI